VERVSQAPRGHPQDLFRETPGDETAVSVTDLDRGEATPEYVALPCARRVCTGTVVDELKNQWGFCGCCSRKEVVTDLAAPLARLNCNLWGLFTRLMGPNSGHHTEAIKSRRNFSFMAGQLAKSGRQRTIKLAVKAER